jgi:hypothetical protein
LIDKTTLQLPAFQKWLTIPIKSTQVPSPPFLSAVSGCCGTRHPAENKGVLNGP